MNSHLTAVQRQDVTGKLVTRHVRTDPERPSKSRKLPAPALGPSAVAKPSQAHFKPRPKQLQVLPRRFKASFMPVDESISSADEQRQSYLDGDEFVFSASAVEMYDVLSVVEANGNAIYMLADGVRSAEDAQQWLSDHGAEHLVIDRTELVKEALEKNLDVEDFVVRSHHSNRWGKKIDAALFFNSTLNRGANGLVMDDIVTGAISYDDIKFLGATKLKSHQRLFSMKDILKQVQKGEMPIEKVKDLLDRSNEENLTSAEFSYVAEVVADRGIDVISEFDKLRPLSEAYGAYHFPYNMAQRYGDTKMDRTMYRARLRDGIDITHYINDKEFYEAGIPVEIAIKAINNGGGVLQAQAMHNEGINENLAEGWL